MKEFFNLHKEFILTILPDFLHNKWTIMVINILIFAAIVKLANFLIEKFLSKIVKFCPK